MKKLFKSLLILAFILASAHTYAQTHNKKAGWCKYAKNGKGTARDESASAMCQACIAEDAKEKKQLEIDAKARAEKTVLKNKADQLASDAKYKQTMKDNKERQKVTEVFVTMPKPSAPAKVAAKKSPEKKVGTPSKMIYMTANLGSSNFRNAITDEVLQGPATFPFKSIEGTYMEEGNLSRNNFPANFGVIELDKTVNVGDHPAMEYFSNADSYKVKDLVDPEFKRFFNSDSISSIVHFYGNWFLISSGFTKRDWVTHSHGAVKLFNVKTRESVPIPEKSFRQSVDMPTFNFHGLKNQPVARNYRFFKGTYEGDGSDGKKVNDRSACEKTFDALTGGPDKWKAFVTVTPYKNKQDRDVQGYAYYCDANEKIVKIKLSQQDFYNLRD